MRTAKASMIALGLSATEDSKGHATDPEGSRTVGRYTLAFLGAPWPVAFSWSLAAFPARNRSALLAGMLMGSPV
jgi:hypothetical protein